MEKAELNFKAKVVDAKYLINYYLKGTNRSDEPQNWNETLDTIQKKLEWNPENEAFARLAAQVSIA